MDTILDQLRAAAGCARPATAADAVAGVPARYVAEPGGDQQVAAVVRAAADHGLTTVVRGAGTRLDWGVPPRALDLVLDTRRLRGVVEHVAGDLVVVVRAGTPLGELAAALAATGQQLALDPPTPGATVGGVVATAAAGPRRLGYGTVRDLLIGITVVLPDGVLTHAGGKVVKNVAGYDLGKLYAGSFGTLGVITECVFRLHPLPAATRYLRVAAPSPHAAGRLLAAVRGGQLAPAAVEVDAPPDGQVTVAVLLEGAAAALDARADAAARLLDGTGAAAGVGVDAAAPPWWGMPPWQPDGTGLRLTAALSQVPVLLTAARAAATRHGVALTVRGSAGVGVLSAGLPADSPPAAVAAVVDQLRAAATAAGGHAVVLVAPPQVRAVVDSWGPVGGLALMRRVKQQFDPGMRFAPGRFVGGI